MDNFGLVIVHVRVYVFFVNKMLSFAFLAIISTCEYMVSNRLNQLNRPKSQDNFSEALPGVENL